MNFTVMINNVALLTFHMFELHRGILLVELLAGNVYELGYLN